MGRSNPYDHPQSDRDYQRLLDRSRNELIGMCRGFMADGVISQNEAECLVQWLDLNRSCAREWPANVIYPRVLRMLEDGVLDPEEQAELLDLISGIVGHKPAPGDRASKPAHIPLDESVTATSFDGTTFCFTGKFAFGTRRKCQDATEDLGAEARSTPSFYTDYLVVGSTGSRAWIQSSWGRKIEKAMDARDEGSEIKIVSEEAWVQALLQQRAEDGWEADED